MVFGSKIQKDCKTDADGLFSGKSNQNLWIYTADCMPILFADKRKRFVAAVHCGRKGLEKKIIKNTIKIFNNIGSYKDDVIVAIGPSISSENYLVDKSTLKEFSKATGDKSLDSSLKIIEENSNLDTLTISRKKELIQLDLKKFAYMQLLNEEISTTNIDISNLCTFKSFDEFYSWRRTKTSLRQWNFICSNSSIN